MWPLCHSHPFFNAYGVRNDDPVVRHQDVSLSFLDLSNAQHSRGEDLSVKISVLPGVGTDPLIEQKIAGIEGKRFQLEKVAFETVRTISAHASLCE